MKTLYFDCFSGASGDMMLGALLDIGGDEVALRAALQTLPIADEFELIVERTNKGGIAGTDVTVRTVEKVQEIISISVHYDVRDLFPENDLFPDDPAEFLAKGYDPIHMHGFENSPAKASSGGLPHDLVHTHGGEHIDIHPVYDSATHDHVHGHEHKHDSDGHHAHGDYDRNLQGILHLMDRMTIDARAKELAASIFRRIAEAEASVHGIPVDQVHFHEVGAVDSIVDIIGSAILLTELDPEKIVVSTLSVGSGMVRCEHGMIPVPAPATAFLLKAASAPSTPGNGSGELLTPTGAAILTAVAHEYGAMPAMTMDHIGYGYGKRKTGSLNALRAVMGEAQDAMKSAGATDADEVTLLEANIDDMTGEELGYLTERLLASGALDAWHTPIYMKKGRPAVMVSALCQSESAGKITEEFLKHSTTLGVRRLQYQRAILPRERRSVNTLYGEIHVKVAGGRAHPEYEDCRRAAEANDLSLRTVTEAAIRAYQTLQIDDSDGRR